MGNQFISQPVQTNPTPTTIFAEDQTRSESSFGGNSSLGNTPSTSLFAQEKSSLSKEARKDSNWTVNMFKCHANFDMDYMVNSTWDPEMWKEWYDKYSSNDNDSLMRSIVVELLFKYTERLIRDRHFVTQKYNGTKIEIREPSRHYDELKEYYLFEKDTRTRLSSQQLADDKITPKYQKTCLYIVNADTISVATVVGREGVVVLHVCNPVSLWNRSEKTAKLGQEEAVLTQTSTALALNEMAYMMNDYTCLYAKGVAVNREGVGKGFAFLETPKRVDVISMPDLLIKKRNERNEYSITQLRRKFEMVLRTCLLHGKSILVLPAFGYKSLNNAKNSAAVIKTVLNEFAGCFKSIYFAVSERYYPKEVVCDYAEVFMSRDGVKIEDIEKNLTKINPIVLDRAKDDNVFYVRHDKEFCNYVGNCTNPDLSHATKYWHPPMCPNHNCTDTSEVHTALYMHKIPCKYGNLCKHHIELVALSIQGKSPNEELRYHDFRFKHNEPCPVWEDCKDTSAEHFKTYSHPPSCTNGLECPQINDPDHKVRFRHDVRICERGADCPFYANGDHTQQFAHPFLPFCPMSPYYCDEKSADHHEKFSHLCQYGPYCKKRNDPEHIRKYIHVGRICPAGASCNDLSEEHLGTYYHDFPGCSTLSAREKCQCVNCADTDEKHRREKRHYWGGNLITMKMLNVQNPDEGATDLMWAPVCENGYKWNQRMDAYLAGKVDTKSKNFIEIVDWFRSMRPNHMCSVEIFLSILNLGCYASLELLRRFWENPLDLLEAVMTCPYMEILREKYAKVLNNTHDTDIRKYAKKMIREKQGDVGATELANASNELRMKLSTAPVISSEKKKNNKEYRVAIESKNPGIGPFLGELDDLIETILKSVLALIKKPTGVGNKTNELTKTNYTPFTIVGPHYDNYGGGQAVMVISKEVMNHPDFYMCPQYTNSYASASYANGRPWITGKAPNGKTYADDFLLEKVSRCSIGWEEAAAKEWIARVSIANNNKDPSTVTLSDITAYYKGGSHSIEGHLPYRVPLDYTEHVILTQAAYNSIVANKLGKAVFEHWEKKYGKSFFTITGGRTQDETAIYQNAHPITKAECRTGMSFHVSDDNEKYLPIDLPDGKFYITFAARGKFFAVLATKLRYDEDGRKVVSISPSYDCIGLSAWYYTPMACMENKKVANNNFFNVSCSYNDFVQYCICVDSPSKTITVTHWGPSSAFSNAVLKVNMEQGVDRYHYISFAMKKTTKLDTVAIWDLNVSADAPDYGLTPEVFVPPKIQNVTNISSSGQAPVNVPQQQTQKQAFSGSQLPQKAPSPPLNRRKGASSGPLPFCSDPFNCPILNNRKDPDHGNHIRTFRHICIYGKDSCKEISKSRHNDMFAHLDKPLCPNGPGCQNMKDPAHRFEYHHKGLRDYLIKCRYGQDCRDKDKNDARHDIYYHDPNFDYPSTFKYV